MNNLKNFGIFFAIIIVALAIFGQNNNNTNVVDNINNNSNVDNDSLMQKAPRGSTYKCRLDFFYKETPTSPTTTRIMVEPHIDGVKYLRPENSYYGSNLDTDYGCYVPVSAGKCVAYKLDSRFFSGINLKWSKCDPNSASPTGRVFQDPDRGEKYYFFSSDHLFVLN